MNVDPKSSRNYEKAIEKTIKMNQGASYWVDDVRFTLADISEKTGLKTKTLRRLLETYDAKTLIAREELKLKKRNHEKN